MIEVIEKVIEAVRAPSRGSERRRALDDAQEMLDVLKAEQQAAEQPATEEPA